MVRSYWLHLWNTLLVVYRSTHFESSVHIVVEDMSVPMFGFIPVLGYLPQYHVRDATTAPTCDGPFPLPPGTIPCEILSEDKPDAAILGASQQDEDCRGRSAISYLTLTCLGLCERARGRQG